MNIINTLIDNFKSVEDFMKLQNEYEHTFHVFEWQKVVNSHAEITNMVSANTSEPFRVMQKSLQDKRDYLHRYLYFEKKKPDKETTKNELYESRIKVDNFNDACRLVRGVVLDNKDIKQLYVTIAKDNGEYWNFFITDKNGVDAARIKVYKIEGGSYKASGNDMNVPEYMQSNAYKVIKECLRKYKAFNMQSTFLFGAYSKLKLYNEIPCNAYKILDWCCYRGYEESKNNNKNVSLHVVNVATKYENTDKEVLLSEAFGHEYTPKYIKELRKLCGEIWDEPFSHTKEELNEQIGKILSRYVEDKNILMNRIEVYEEIMNEHAKLMGL